MTPDFNTVTEFENRIAEFFGAPYAVAVDSCTSAVELCLRYTKAEYINCPTRTYLSIPMLANKLGIELRWYDIIWQDAYWVTQKVIDAAVFWERNGYQRYNATIPGAFMCVSFQYQKHLSVGRLGVILCDNKEAAIELKKLSYDGRLPGVPWRNQNIESYGYHYYATPEAARKALDKIDAAINTQPKIWTQADYPDISEMKVFKNNHIADNKPNIKVFANGKLLESCDYTYNEFDNSIILEHPLAYE